MTRSERSWGLVVDGGDGNQFSPIFADAIAYECSYPVSDGTLSLDGLDCILSKSSFSSIDWEDEKDLETFRTDLKNVGCDDDEITEFFNDEISEIEFYIDFYIDIDYLYNDIYSGVHEKELSYEDKLEEYGLPEEVTYTFDELGADEDTDMDDIRGLVEDTLSDEYGYTTEEFAVDYDADGNIRVSNIVWDLDESLKESTTQDDIDAKVDDKKEVAKEKEEKAIDDADSDRDYELDETLFDNLINKYCTRVYENVKDYKTTNGYTQDHKLVLEGLLTYKSGKTTNTKFIFEKKMTKDKKVKYVGLNETFSKSKRAFSLNCNIKNNKILSESLTYNYKVKVNEDRKVVYGSIKNN